MEELEERIVYRDGQRRRVSITFADLENSESRTKQEFKLECDINEVIRRWTKTGVLPTPRAAEKYGDFTQVNDYQTAINRVNEADHAFMELPSAMRAKFHNSAGELLEYLEDPNNAQEAIDLGLLPGTPTPPAPPVVETPTTPEATPVAGGE